MDDFLSQRFDQLFGRLAGPFHFRFILQPAVATVIAIRAGLRDAAAHRPAYLWTFLSQPTKRHLLVLDAWKDVGKVFSLAIVLDIIYQIVVFRWIHPVETLIVAFTLAVVPYVLMRGPIARIAGRRRSRVSPMDTQPTQKTL